MENSFNDTGWEYPLAILLVESLNYGEEDAIAQLKVTGSMGYAYGEKKKREVGLCQESVPMWSEDWMREN